jgi:uncharacterized damage-inducible protein DinB
MRMNELFREQLEREVPATRRILERVPAGKDDWKPHPKSMPLGYLASLVATMPGWIATMVNSEFLDLGTGGAGGGRPSDLSALFDRTVADARTALTGTDDEHLSRPWQLRVTGKVVDEKPRYAMIADTLSHFAHHRGQLGVYLRLLDIPIPSIYGPTADESWQEGPPLETSVVGSRSVKP